MWSRPKTEVTTYNATTEVVTTKTGSQPKTEVVTHNVVERKDERGRNIELWSGHQFLKTTEPTRSRL